MKGVYTDGYGKLYEEYGCVMSSLANTLTKQANHFYNQTVCGYNISEIAYPPNEIIIEDIVLNTMSDLNRLMNFHPVTKPTRYKYAAYTGFWWLRGKPFLCKLDYATAAKNLSDPHFRDLCTSLNEIFIIDFMLSMIQLKRNPTETPCADHVQTFPYMELKDSLHYFLKYRHCTAQELELFLKGIDTCPFGYIVRCPKTQTLLFPNDTQTKNQELNVNKNDLQRVSGFCKLFARF